MIEKRENEWLELESRAKRIFENPRLLPKDDATKLFTPILHLWISPTFTPEKHWIFYKPQSQLNPLPKPIIRQLIWERQADFERLNNPLVGLKEGFQTAPTFEIKTVEIEQKNFENLHQQLAEIRFPAFVKDEFLGLDGERFGVETLGSYHSAKVFWWSSYPPEWKELVEWYEKIRKFLEEKFDDG